jgi:hypothetical protein
MHPQDLAADWSRLSEGLDDFDEAATLKPVTV